MGLQLSFQIYVYSFPGIFKYMFKYILCEYAFMVLQAFFPGLINGNDVISGFPAYYHF